MIFDGVVNHLIADGLGKIKGELRTAATPPFPFPGPEPGSMHVGSLTSTDVLRLNRENWERESFARLVTWTADNEMGRDWSGEMQREETGEERIKRG